MAKIWIFPEWADLPKIGYFPENVKLDVFKHSYLEKVMVTKVLKFYSDASKGPRINIEPKKWYSRIFLFRLPAQSDIFGHFVHNWFRLTCSLFDANTIKVQQMDSLFDVHRQMLLCRRRWMQYALTETW